MYIYVYRQMECIINTVNINLQYIVGIQYEHLFTFINKYWYMYRYTVHKSIYVVRCIEKQTIFGH